jgi:hypothetical protein
MNLRAVSHISRCFLLPVWPVEADRRFAEVPAQALHFPAGRANRSEAIRTGFAGDGSDLGVQFGVQAVVGSSRPRPERSARMRVA